MKKSTSDELSKIEKLMSSSLQPVNPRPEFINQLHLRLTDPLTPSIRYPQDYSLRFGLLLIASLVSGVIFLITISQVILALLRETKITEPLGERRTLKLE
jgi:hypothetical protein